MRQWLVAAVWVAWLVVSAGTGYTATGPADRVAEDATRASVRADGLMFAAMLAGAVVAIVLPAAALPGSPWLGLVLGAALVTAGLALRHWAARTLGGYFTRSVAIGPDHRVVDTGPYRHLRHPGYTGALLSLAGLGLTLWSWLGLVIIVVGCFLAFVPRIRAEEAAVEASLGAAYRDFARTRKRLVPGIW
jgi:protein-S-isoprenylcysteine O-methyltransferase Ste14